MQKLALFAVLLLAVVRAPAAQPVTVHATLKSEDAQQLLARWFETDRSYPINAKRIALEPDELGARFRIEFDTEDGQRVNGLLAMPPEGSKPARLAFALHPMGRDLGIWSNHDKPLFGGQLTDRLRRHGYAILSLDARRHGERRSTGVGVREILDRAHSDNPRLYNDMITGSVRDYRLALTWAAGEADLDTRGAFAMGYSMGAQMSLLLAALEPQVLKVLAMVPPYIQEADSPVAPRHHVAQIAEASVLLLAAGQDPYSSVAQTRQVFDGIAADDKEIAFFDSGHVLPASYVTQALRFIDAESGGRKQ